MVKSERTTTDEGRSRDATQIDLTADGDNYVLPSRKIGDTIVLSDDESDDEEGEDQRE
jgi:hypothetical protein